MAMPNDYLCVGFDCNKCIEACPEKALIMDIHPASKVIGDRRWTSDLIIGTWYMAETGRVPPGGVEYKIGDSNGGFDRLEFKFLRDAPTEELDPNEFSTVIPLNRSGDNREKILIDIPVYGGGMSYGSIALKGHNCQGQSMAGMEFVYMHWRGRLSSGTLPL